MTTGLSVETFANLQLNAGIFLKNFDYSQYTTVSALKEAIKTAATNVNNRLGATRGGGSFQATPTVRNIAADGKRYEYVGSTVIDMWTVRMTGTLIEATPGNFKALLMTAESTPSGEQTVMKLRTQPKEEDYINLVWVGDTSRGYVLISLKNVLNRAGMRITFTDRGEGTLPFEFVAHQDKVDDYDYAPCEIVFLTESATAQAAE